MASKLRQLRSFSKPCTKIHQFYNFLPKIVTYFFRSRMGREGGVVGRLLSCRRRFRRADVTSWMQLTGDQNPIHPAIVPGLLTASLFPALFSSYFPGAIYLRQSLTFRRPISIDQVVVVEIMIDSVRESRRRISCSTIAKYEDESCAIDGTAELLLPTIKPNSKT
jgi:3-hydroxybutyryl-CoA dehydratase